MIPVTDATSEVQLERSAHSKLGERDIDVHVLNV